MFSWYYSADDPTNDPSVTGDPYKTLFVARLVSRTSYMFIKFNLSQSLFIYL